MERENSEWIKWRWEFLRRNKQYQKDFRKVEKLRKVSSFTWTDEKKYCSKWGLSISRMLDPDKSFEEITETKSDSQDTKRWAKNLLNQWLFSKGLDTGAVKEIHTITRDDGAIGLQATQEELMGKNKLILCIDFEMVNSLKALIEVITELLKRKFDSLGTEISNIKEKDWFGERSFEVTFSKKPRKRQTYLVDYDIILQVGDMKEEEDLKNREIAKKLFPRDFREDNKDANPESAIRKVGHYWKKYKELVNGGYKNITYP